MTTYRRVGITRFFTVIFLIVKNFFSFRLSLLDFFFVLFFLKKVSKTNKTTDQSVLEFCYPEKTYC